MKETENNLSVANIGDTPLTPNEIFLKVFAHHLMSRIPKTVVFGESDYHYLHRQLKYMKDLQTHLELPWQKFIPVLYEATSFYVSQNENKKQSAKVIRLTTELMKCILFLSDSGPLIAQTADFYDTQIKEIERIMKLQKVQTDIQV